MKQKFYFLLTSAILFGISGFAQPTVELSTTNFAAGQGPATANIGPIAMMKDNSNNNNFTNLGGPDVTNVTFSLVNQQYPKPVNNKTYSNISTGLVFGAAPTTATSFNFPAVQEVDPLPMYQNLGYYLVSPGGPTDNMFTVSPSFTSGTGIVAQPSFDPNPPDVNGAVSVFTAAQYQFDQTGGPSVNNASTRYYYGDLVITFNRFIRNPVVHIAGLGGSYRYFPTSGTNPNDPSQWRSTFFSTELEIENFGLSKLSGNSFLGISGQFIVNNSATPNGASVNTTGGLFNEIGAASGSIRIAATLNQIRIKVYLRGSNSNTPGFDWSTVGSNVSGSNRDPFTGDIWWVSVSTDATQLIPLPSTGVRLSGALRNNDVQLSWKTQTEINSKHFEIERSTDGVNFSAIGIKNAAGNSVSDINYDYLDLNVQSDVTYYRLKMVDIDSRYNYSNIVVIRKSKDGVKGVRIYPNPSNGIFNMEFSNAKGTYTLGLYNQAGQEVMRKQLVVDATVQNVPVGTGTLPAGTYLLSIRNSTNTEVYSQKIVLTK